MGRPRNSNKHLPRRLHLKCGTYWYVFRKDGKYVWEKLGRDYASALMRWAEIEGRDLERERSIEHAIAHYLETEKHRLRSTTLDGYKRSAARLIAVFGKMELADLTPNHVYEYVRRAGNVQANRDKALLSAVYKGARSWGWYRGDNPARGIRANREVPRRRYVTDEELELLVASVPARIALIVKWAYLTGMRLSDILALKLTSAVPSGVQFVPSKTRDTKPNPMIIEWTDDLRSLWRAAAGDRIGAQPLFATAPTLSRKAGHYTLSGFETVWQRAKISAGFAEIQFRDLRRKAGSDVEGEHARALLGHQDVRTTRKHYRAKPERVKPVR